MWSKIARLKGSTLHTVSRKKPFVIENVTDATCMIWIGSSNKLRPIPRKEIEKAFELGDISSMSPSLLREKKISEANPAYVFAIVKHLS